MKKLLSSLVISSFLFISCEKEETIHQTPCNGNCGTNYIVVYENQEIFPNVNGHYEVEWDGTNNFGQNAREYFCPFCLWI